MKITRRKTITIREREVIIERNTIPEIEDHFCPFCNAPIHPRELPVKRLNGPASVETMPADEKF